MKAAIGFIFFMLFLAGIAFINLKGMRQASDNKVNLAADLAGTGWRLSHLGEQRLSVDPDENSATIQFGADKITGNAGCNDYFADFEMTNGELKFGAIGSTRKSCPEPAMSLEISYLNALGEAVQASKTDTVLALRDARGIILCRFAAAAQAPNAD